MLLEGLPLMCKDFLKFNLGWHYLLYFQQYEEKLHAQMNLIWNYKRRTQIINLLPSTGQVLSFWASCLQNNYQIGQSQLPQSQGGKKDIEIEGKGRKMKEISKCWNEQKWSQNLNRGKIIPISFMRKLKLTRWTDIGSKESKDGRDLKRSSNPVPCSRKDYPWINQPSRVSVQPLPFL